MRMRLRSRATSAPDAGTPRATRTEGRRRSRLRRLDRRLAVGAHLPDRLERGAAAHACLLELRRADGTDEIARVDLRVTDRAAKVGSRDPLLDRLDLQLPLAHVLEVL